jgi:hypothetical protein
LDQHNVSKASFLVLLMVKDTVDLEIPAEMHVSFAPFKHLVVGKDLLEFPLADLHPEAE